MKAGKIEILSFWVRWRFNVIDSTFVGFGNKDIARDMQLHTKLTQRSGRSEWEIDGVVGHIRYSSSRHYKKLAHSVRSSINYHPQVIVLIHSKFIFCFFFFFVKDYRNNNKKKYETYFSLASRSRFAPTRI